MTNEPESMLFPQAERVPDATPAIAAPRERTGVTPRLNRPERLQGEMRCESLDQRLDADHPARLVWKLVEGLYLSALYQQIDAVEGIAWSVSARRLKPRNIWPGSVRSARKAKAPRRVPRLPIRKPTT
jgi:hypothetical protein